MRYFAAMAFLTALMLLGLPALAQTTEAPAGVTPDSFLYNLDVALDRIKLLMTFDNTEKARLGLAIAEERLSEVREMTLRNKLAAMQRAQDEHRNSLDAVRASATALSRTNPTQQISEEVDIERELEEHEEKVERISSELEVKVRLRGNITAEQQALIDSVLSRLQNVTGEVKIEIRAKKGETKIRIKQETGKSDSEIDEEIRSIEIRKGLTEIRLKKTAERMEDAVESIGEAEEKLILVQQANLTIPNSVKPLLEQANRRLLNAEKALNETDFGEAFGQATEAGRLAENVERQLERLLEDKEGEEEEVEIEAEIKEGETKVEVKVGDRKLKITVPTTNRGQIISHIADRTGLSESEVERLLKIETEDENDDDRRESVKRIRKFAERVKEEALVVSKDVRETAGRTLRNDDKTEVEKRIEEAARKSEEDKESEEEKSETESRRGSNSGESDED